MYVETDFLLALIKDEDWLGDAAETVYNKHKKALWTSQYTLVELLLVAYREDRDAEAVIANAIALVEVNGDATTVLAAATQVEEHGLTPFDALHLVESGDETIVSSDKAYKGLSPLMNLRNDE